MYSITRYHEKSNTITFIGFTYNKRLFVNNYIKENHYRIIDKMKDMLVVHDNHSVFSSIYEIHIKDLAETPLLNIVLTDDLKMYL